MLNLAWPWMLLLLPAPWLAARVLPAARGDGEGVLFFPATAALAEAGARAGRSATRSGWLRWGALACWSLLVLAAARPQWTGEPIELPQSGRNLMLAVDVSGSMANTDLEPSGRVSRLDLVKRVAGDFIRRREGDRLGLILFGSQAYLQAPLTLDRQAVAQLLGESVVGIAGRQTAIGDAIGLALKRMRAARQACASCDRMVLILLTDGANTAGHVAPRKAAELAAQAGLKIYTIGVGGRARQVRGPFGMPLTVPDSDLDEDTLKAIARITGGRYFRASDRQGLEAIYRQLDRLEPVVRGTRSLRPVDELYAWPLGAAWLLSLGLAILVWRRGGAV
jgi:Ca-activated chloride channel family protein